MGEQSNILIKWEEVELLPSRPLSLSLALLVRKREERRSFASSLRPPPFCMSVARSDTPAQPGPAVQGGPLRVSSERSLDIAASVGPLSSPKPHGKKLEQVDFPSRARLSQPRRPRLVPPVGSGLPPPPAPGPPPSLARTRAGQAGAGGSSGASGEQVSPARPARKTRSPSTAIGGALRPSPRLLASDVENRGGREDVARLSRKQCVSLSSCWSSASLAPRLVGGPLGRWKQGKRHERERERERSKQGKGEGGAPAAVRAGRARPPPR